MKNKKNRKKGLGSLYQRPGERYWRARWMRNGKVQDRSTGTANRKEAEKTLEEWTAPYRLKTEAETIKALQAKMDGILESARPQLSFAEAWAKFEGNTIDRKRGNDRDETLYRGRWRKFADWMASNRPTVASLDAVEEETAKAFLAWIQKTSAPKTFNLYRALLSQVWTVLAKDAGLTSNPWKAIKPLPVKGDTRPERKLTDAELEKLFKYLETEAPEIRLFFLLGIYTGQRSNDCALLKWDSVDLEGNCIYCVPHKTATYGTKVECPIHEVLAAELEKTPPDKREGYVLPQIAEAFKTRQNTVSRWIKETFEKAGIKTHADEKRNGRSVAEVGFHSFRHTFASICALYGVPVAVVERILGHTSEAMTRAYAQVDRKDLYRVLPALPSPETANAAKAKRQKALKVFAAAVNGLLAAGLTKSEWGTVGAILARANKALAAPSAAQAR